MELPASNPFQSCFLAETLPDYGIESGLEVELVRLVPGEPRKLAFSGELLPQQRAFLLEPEPVSAAHGTAQHSSAAQRSIEQWCASHRVVAQRSAW